MFTDTHTHTHTDTQTHKQHTHTHTHTHTHRDKGTRSSSSSSTHMFFVSNVPSPAAGDKSIIGTEVQGGKRLSAGVFPHAIDPILLASPARCQLLVARNPGTVMD